MTTVLHDRRPDGTFTPGSMTGSRNPNWKGGTVYSSRFASPEYERFRRQVFDRDSYICHDCGRQCCTTEKGVAAHHLVSYRAYPEYRYDVSQALTLCANCHQKRHGRLRHPRPLVECACGCGLMVLANIRRKIARRLPAPDVNDARLRARFWANVEKSEGCWLWTRTIRRGGYGALKAWRKDCLAHRVAWELVYGPIPAGQCVCHSCDVFYAPGDIRYRRCVRPDHLFLGTVAENNADAKRKGRQAQGDRSPSRLHIASRPRGAQHWARRRPDLLKRGAAWHAVHPAARHVRGEAHPKSKLTPQIVRAIRQRYEAGDRNKAALAREYGVSKKLILNIVTRRTWKHV